MRPRRPLPSALPYAFLAALAAFAPGCEDDRGGRASKGGLERTAITPCEIAPSIEATPDDDGKVGLAARTLLERGPCVVAAGRRWFAKHPAAYSGEPAGRVIVRAIAGLVPTLPSDVREEALDLLLEAEASGDAFVRRDAVAGLSAAPKPMTVRILHALETRVDAERARAIALIDVLALAEPELVPAYVRLLDDSRGEPDPDVRAALVGALRRIRDPIAVGLDALGREGEHRLSVDLVVAELVAQDERGLCAALRRRWSGLATPLRSAYVVAIRRAGAPSPVAIEFLRWVVGSESSEAVRSDAAAVLPP